MRSRRSLPSLRRRANARGVTPVEAAIAFAIFGAILAVAVPAFIRELHGSRFVEPVSGLERMSAGAIAYAASHPGANAFPETAPLTPPVVPRARREVDPPNVWDTPSWKALDFRAAPEGTPHAYAFGFTSTPATPAAPSQFVAHAHGDLDGDGVTSTFEVRGHANAAGPAEQVPGMYVEAELE
ncbi:MAG: hypothetical protein JWM74_4489 [Myxococcaceae bacterium]|nr:hypothetical protein [Myxococcaceae bacterium]